MPSCLLLPCDAHGFLCEPRLLRPRAVRVGVCVLQRQEGVGSDGALALALRGGQQVVDGQLSRGERDGGNLGRGGEGLQLLEVLLLLHQLVEQHLLLILGGKQRGKPKRGGGGGGSGQRQSGRFQTRREEKGWKEEKSVIINNPVIVRLSDCV